MDKANFLPLSTEVLAATLNISSEELSTLFDVNDDGVKTPKDDKTISTFFKSKLGNRIEQVVKEKTEPIERDAESKYRRLIYKEIEDKAKELYGVDMRWSEDGFSKIETKLSDGEKKPVDVTRSQEFKDMVKEYEDKLKLATEEADKKVNEYKTQSVKRSLKADLYKMLKAKEKELAIPASDEVLDYQIDIMLDRDLTSGDLRLDYIDGKPAIVDSEGKIAQDKANGWQPYDVDSFITNVAKSKYFPELKAPPISSPNPVSNNGTVKIDGSDKTYSIPTFKTMEELGKFTQEAQVQYEPKVAAALVKEANKQLDALTA